MAGKAGISYLAKKYTNAKKTLHSIHTQLLPTCTVKTQPYFLQSYHNILKVYNFFANVVLLRSPLKQYPINLIPQKKYSGDCTQLLLLTPSPTSYSRSYGNPTVFPSLCSSLNSSNHQEVKIISSNSTRPTTKR